MKKITTINFIEKSKKIHGDKYDYSKVKYETCRKKVCIICPKHGEFWMSPENHTHKTHPQGCPKCNGGVSLTKEEFIEKARQVHGDKYDYSKVEYKNTHSNICIICKEHGEFLQTPHNHLKGKGCPDCAGNIQLTTEEFIKRAQQIHGNRYDYSKVNYKNNHDKVCIICPNHGEFFQRPYEHLNGKGCRYCNISHLENTVQLFLDNLNIRYLREVGKETFKFLGNQRLDFFLPDFNTAIECQGEQHFKPVVFFGENSLEKNIRLDKEKASKCKENGVNLLYFSNLSITYPYKVFEDLQELIEEATKKRN